VEYRFRRRDGSYCWVNDAQRLVRGIGGGKPLEIVGSWNDITARKAAEEANAALHARMAQLLTGSPAVIYSYRATGDFAPTFVSANVRDWLGCETVEYLQNADFWRSHVHPDDLARVEAESSNLYKDGRHAVEYRFLKKDGTYCWVNDEQRLIRGEDGQPIEVIGSWSDITRRKQAEEAAAAANNRVQHLLARSPAVRCGRSASHLQHCIRGASLSWTGDAGARHPIRSSGPKYRRTWFGRGRKRKGRGVDRTTPGPTPTTRRASRAAPI
jgi:adenylate cyclase